MEIAALVEQTRCPDGFVFATPWCQRYGRQIFRFKDLPETQRSIASLSEALGGIKVVESHGRNGTYMHPVLFMELIRWLDPDLYLRLVPRYSAFFGQSCRES